MNLTCNLIILGCCFLASLTFAQEKDWQTQYDLIFPFSEGLAAVRQDGLFGYVDENGNEVIKPEWKEAGYFSEGIAIVKNSDGYGGIDKTGKVVIKCHYDYIRSFQHGVAAAFYQDDYWGLLNKKGEELTTEKYSHIGGFHDGRASVLTLDRELIGYINTAGEEVIKTIYESNWGYMGFSEGLARVEKEDKDLFINTSGEVAIDLEMYDGGMPFQNGLAPVSKNELIGFIDKTGQLVIDHQYKLTWGFTETGHCWVKTDKGWGVINKTGATVLEPQYKIAIGLQYKHGDLPRPSDIVSVTNDKDDLFDTEGAKWTIVGVDGKAINAEQYDEIVSIQEPLMCVKKNGLFALLDLSGNPVVPFLLDDIKIGDVSFLDAEGVFQAKIEDTWYYFDSKGNRLGKVRP